MEKMENLPSNQNITYRLISAVREGNLEEARKLINSLGLSYSEAWSGGYVLLCDALKNKHAPMAKLLLTSGSKVNIKNEEPTDTPLHFAVMSNNIEIVKMILNKGADVDAKNEYSKTSLHVAAEIGYSQIAEHLLDSEANVNCACTGRKNYTPLHFAVENGHTEVVTLLLSRGADVDAKGEDSITPLHIAAKNGSSDRYIRIAEDLLNHGACIHSSTLKKGYTPLHFASEQFNDKTVKLFLDREADIHARTKDDSTPLHTATRRGCERIVKFLLQQGAQVDNQDKNGKTILLIATEEANSTIVEDILKFCPDTHNQSNKSSLKISAMGCLEEEFGEICEALLEYGFIVDPEDANDPELLHAAVEKGYLNIVEDLLKYGADVNALIHDSSYKEGFTPLHSAAENKQEEVAELLIRYEADVNAQDKTGKTPIFYAIENSDLDITELLLTNRANIKGNPELVNIAVEKKCIKIVEALLENGADINAIDEHGRTALHFTAPSEDDDIPRVRRKYRDMNIMGEIAELLLSQGADIDAQTKDGVTTLHAAAENGYVEVVEVLLGYNVNVNSKDKNDCTPLHHSARKGNEDITIMLLDEEADVNAKQKKGMTPLHLAAQEKHLKVVELLLENGAEVNSKMKYDTTPLHLSTEYKCPYILETILKFGADIDSRDKDGKTALHMASDYGYVDAVESLLEYGADINMTDKDNHTALDIVLDGIKSWQASYLGSDYHNYDFDNYISDDEFRNDSRYYDLFHTPSRYVAEALTRHIIKMKIANLYVSEQNLLAINDIRGMSDFQDECEEEILRMKSEKIDNCKISFYDILSKDTNSLAMCMKNVNILQVLESNDYESEFRKYADMIGNNCRRATGRIELLREGIESFYSLSNDLPGLPYDCAEKILSFLSNENLENLIDACKPFGISSPNTNDN